MATSQFVSRFKEIGIHDRPTVGGKGASLGELASAGIRVPNGCVVTIGAFERFLTALDPSSAIRSAVSQLSAQDSVSITQLGEQVRAQIQSAPLPDDLQSAIASHYEELNAAPANSSCPVAIRSSATSEDSAEASFAGLQDTYLWVRGADSVIHHVRKCWASLYSVESLTYRRRLNLPEEGLAMGVVIQQMIDSRCSGVMFTRSPTTGDRSVVVLEASWGLGSAIVSGEVTPDKYVVSKVTGEIVQRTVSTKLREHLPNPHGAGVSDQEVPADRQNVPCLSDDEIHALVKIARQVERHYGAPQDIEWAVSRIIPPAKTSSPAEPSGNRLGLQRQVPRRRSQRQSLRPRSSAPEWRSHQKMKLTNQDVQEILDLLDATKFDVLHLQTERFKLTLRRQSTGDWAQESESLSPPQIFQASAGSSAASAQTTELPRRIIHYARDQRTSGTIAIRASLPGTFYRAPGPGAPPFVDIGSAVTEDTVIGIIETMKLMNAIHAGARGTISEILTPNAHFAEQNAILMRIKRENS